MGKRAPARLAPTGPLWDDVNRVAGAFKALGCPSRLVVLSELSPNPEGVEVLRHLADQMGLNLSTIRHHLHWLHEAGLIERRDDGVHVVIEAEFCNVAETLRQLIGDNSQ